MGFGRRSFLAIASGGLVAVAALSLRKGGEEARVSLHPCDLPPHQSMIGGRTWKAPSQLAHHLRELAQLGRPLASTYLLRTISPAFREKVMLVTAMANACRWCTWAHSRFARAAGLSEIELKALIALDPRDFPRREWVALAWVRAFMENAGEVPAELDEEFRAILTPQERACVLASHKAMFVFNLTANNLRAMLNRLRGRGDETAACGISL